MEYLKDLREDTIAYHTAVTVGKFDGIHKGHELLTHKIMEQKANGLKSVVFTFDTSPRTKLEAGDVKNLITNQERAWILAQEGVDYLIEYPFSQEVMHMEPEAFVELLVTKVHMAYLAVGTDFHFGYMGRGDVTLLQTLSKKYGFQLQVIEKMKQNHRDISSTYVREEIRTGNIEKANELLGYGYFVWGHVVHGTHIGHTIGIPTINLIPPADKLLPPNGVYVTQVVIHQRTYHGVTNIGVKPTIQGERQIGIETHILDFDEDVYEQKVKVVFLKYLRPEMKFENLDSLKEQMKKDTKQALEYFNQDSYEENEI